MKSIRKAGLLLVSLALALLLGEGLARAFTPYQRGVSWYQYDDRYEFRHRSNLDVETTEWGDGQPWRLRTNSRGFRGAEWNPRPVPGVKRLLVVGDSFTMGNAVSEAEAFPAVAEAALGQPGDPWQVVNLGVSAWGPENALGWLETEGADVEATCLVYAFYLGNDMVDHRRSRLFVAREGRLERRPNDGKPTPAARARAVLRAFPPYEFLIAHSQLFNVVRQVALTSLFGGGSGGAEGGNVGHEQGSPPGASPSGSAFGQSVRHTEAVLTRLAATSRGRFGCFGVFVVPSRAGLLSRAPVPSLEARLATDSREALLLWTARTGTPMHDASDAFPVDPAVLGPLFFGRDFHCTVAGNALLGHELAAFAPRLVAEARKGRSL